MALYAIGDVQGCYEPLVALLDKINFDSQRDRLWFTGDLVNRGPQSLAVLRLVAGLGERAVAVLGNHDLHLLAVAAGQAKLRPRDTLADVLSAPDREPLLAWLRERPLLHHDAEAGHVLVHAGVVPQWDLAQARDCASEAEAILRSEQHTQLYAHMYGDMPDRWNDELTGWDRLRFTINSFTRLRYCDATGRIDLTHKGPPGTQPVGWLPWFEASGRRTANERIIFGHWSTLGIWDSDRVIGLDAGCVWGGMLAAIRVAGGAREIYRVACTSRQ